MRSSRCSAVARAAGPRSPRRQLVDRQRKLRPALAQGAVQRFGALRMEIEPTTPGPERLFELATVYGLSACVAVYLELALRRGLPLACCDVGLPQAATPAGLFLDPG